jgi:hypothetical protein
MSTLLGNGAYPDLQNAVRGGWGGEERERERERREGWREGQRERMSE